MKRTNRRSSLRRNSMPVIKLDIEQVEKKLHGRTEEFEAMTTAYQLACSADSKVGIVLVSGASGTGKTYLVRKLGDKVRHDGKGFYVSGKYDQYQQVSEPFSAIVNAFNDLCEQILQLPKKQCEFIKAQINASLGVEAKLLASLVPALTSLIEESAEEGSVSVCSDLQTLTLNPTSSKRVLILFQTLIETLCSPGRPLVVFLDDYQWADSSSRELMHFILSAKEIENCMFVMTSRSEKAFEEIVSLLSTQVNPGQLLNIKLTNFKQEVVNELLSDLLKQDQDHTMALANVVMTKTAGNSYHLLRYLEQLNRMNLLQFSIVTNEWQWDIDAIALNTDVAENVVEILTQQLEVLPGDCLYTLSLASCLGFVFHKTILTWLLIQEELYPPSSEKEARTIVESVTPEIKDAFDERLDKILKHASEEGLAQCISGTFLWRFSHDRVQQCCYDRLPDGEEREHLHVRIGRLIHACDTEKTHIFLATDQLNRGSSHLTKDSDRLDLVRMNLEAATKSSTQSAFLPASQFLRHALKLLNDRDWMDHYELALEIHSLAAEIEFSCGKMIRAEEVANVVVTNGRTVDDKLRAYAVMVGSLGGQKKFTRATTLSCSVLRLLGVAMPKKPNILHVVFHLFKTKAMVRGMTDEDYFNLPVMTDKRQILAMKFLAFCDTYGTLCSYETVQAMSVFLMMQLTLRYGLSFASGHALGSYGTVLAVLGDHLEGERLGNVGLKIADTWEDPVAIPRTYLSCYGFVSHFKIPLLNLLDPLLSGYRIGLETGDLDYGSYSLALYGNLYFLVGLPLAPYVQDVTKFCRQLLGNNQETCVALLAPFLQFALNLTGKSQDVLCMSKTSPEMIEMCGEKFWEISGTDLDAITVPYKFADMYLLYIMGKLQQAKRVLKELNKVFSENVVGTCFVVYFIKLVSGMVCFDVYREEGKRRYKRLGNKYIKWFETLVKLGSVNGLGMLMLLKAMKLSASSKDAPAVRQGFDQAIVSISRSSSVSVSAFANEKAGEAMARLGESYWSTHYFKQAIQLYRDWGAVVKVRHVLETHIDGELSEMMMDDKTLNSNILGRQRFEDAQLESPSHRKSAIEMMRSSMAQTPIVENSI